jgi:hypothetical protein
MIYLPLRQRVAETNIKRFCPSQADWAEQVRNRFPVQVFSQFDLSILHGFPLFTVKSFMAA